VSDPQDETTRPRRMIGVFGWREMEMAAIRILDARWTMPWEPIDAAIFKTDDEREGFAGLMRNGWIASDRTPTSAFWSRVHGR
jgi:hypothetical protein